jgi:hypothetical protein
MKPWPGSWRFSDADIPVGEGLVSVMKPFIEHLCDRGLAHKTVRSHLDNCWVIGGEIIRGLEGTRKSRRLDPRTIILDAIDGGEAPLARNFDEQEQRQLDATAKKLFRFLTNSQEA